MSAFPTPASDHFSSVAQHYAECRPGYPAELFAWLAKHSPGTDAVWDCAAGNGQASLGLAEWFDRVYATDLSPAQIAAARCHPRIDYRVADACHSGLAEHSVDLVTVAQALHWLDLPGFYAEARRVLRPGGLLAVWSYGVQQLDDPACNALVQAFYTVELGPYWPRERHHVENGYRDLAFPFTTIAAPPLLMHADWDLPQLLGYFRSWSATARFRQAHGRDPTESLAVQLAQCWGDPGRQRRVAWPLSVRAGRV